MSLDNGLNISLQFTYFPFFLIKKREGGRGGGNGKEDDTSVNTQDDYLSI